MAKAKADDLLLAEYERYTAMLPGNVDALASMLTGQLMTSERRVYDVLDQAGDTNSEPVKVTIRIERVPKD